MDAIYPVGPGSRWKDNELRYSLRSLAMHAPEVDRVIIVGRKPKFVGDVLHIPHQDDHGVVANQLLKMKAALVHVTDHRFVWMNDDFYLTGPQYWTFVHHIATPKWRDGVYGRAFQAARKYLSSVGIPVARDHELHIPVAYDTLTAGNLLSRIPTLDIAFRTVYFNIVTKASTPMHDVKVKSAKEVRPTWSSFSSSNAAVTTLDFQHMLERMYPDPSPWEVRG